MYVTPPDTDVYAIPKVLAPMPQKVVFFVSWWWFTFNTLQWKLFMWRAWRHFIACHAFVINYLTFMNMNIHSAHSLFLCTSYCCNSVGTCSIFDVLKVIMGAITWQSHQSMHLEIPCINLRGKCWRLGKVSKLYHMWFIICLVVE